MENKRIDYFDNLKGMLIALVVLGHAIEPLLYRPSIYTLYLIIYSFHMPLFICVSGYFSSVNRGKIVRSLVLPYLIFQSLYLMFDVFVLKGTPGITVFTPYWILWYLFSLIIWRVILIGIKEVRLQHIIIAFIVAILVGFDTSVGYYLGLSRTIVFFPFFLLGRYAKQDSFDINNFKTTKFKVIFGLLATTLVSLIYLYTSQISRFWLYGSYAYESAPHGYNPQIRILIFIVAILMSIAVLIFVPRKKVGLVSFWGKQSLSIFIFHGFIMKFLVANFPFENLVRIEQCLLYVGIVTILTLTLLSLPPFTTLMKVITLKNKLANKKQPI